MKLIEFPTVLFTWLMAYFTKERVWSGLLMLTLIFYIYINGGREGESKLAIDITLFVLAVVQTSVVSYMLRNFQSPELALLANVLTNITFMIFILFSYVPPTDNAL
jgi:hypothetical protein